MDSEKQKLRRRNSDSYLPKRSHHCSGLITKPRSNLTHQCRVHLIYITSRSFFFKWHNRRRKCGGEAQIHNQQFHFLFIITGNLEKKGSSFLEIHTRHFLGSGCYDYCEKCKSCTLLPSSKNKHSLNTSLVRVSWFSLWTVLETMSSEYHAATEITKNAVPKVQGKLCHHRVTWSFS